MMITEHPHDGWSVYVLRNLDGKLYIGQTRNLSHRLHQHNDPAHTLTRATKRFRGPWELCALGDISIAISCPHTREGAQVWPGQSLAKNSSSPLIRLRRDRTFESYRWSQCPH